MSLQIDGAILVIVGILAVFFRKNFAKFVIWYHTKRWYRRKSNKNKSEYPTAAWSVSGRLIQVYALIIGIAFVIIGASLLFNLFAPKPRINVIHHSEALAAQQAVRFVEVAFIRNDYEQAYLLLSKNFRKNFSFEKFKSLCEEIHPKYFPAVIRATHFEPMPGQKAMYIFLCGEKRKEKLYYRIIMEGTKQTNYKVFGIHRSESPYLPSKLRQPLKINITNSL